MAYFTQDKLVAAAHKLEDNTAPIEERQKAEQYLSDYADYLDALVIKKGWLLTPGFTEAASGIRKFIVKTKEAR